MIGRSQRKSKLSNVRLTLSKYDAKYSRQSSILDDDSSDEEESGTKPLPISSPSLFLETVKSFPLSDDGAFQPIQCGDNVDGGNITLHNNVERNIQKSNLEISKHMPPTLDNLDSLPHVSDYSSSADIEENSMIKTASSIDSVKTDSAFGFNNVHSVSSLAESALPFNEEEIQTPHLIVRHAQSSTSSNSHSLKSDSANLGSILKKSPVENLPSSPFIEPSDEKLFESAETTDLILHLSLGNMDKMEPFIEEEKVEISQSKCGAEKRVKLKSSNNASQIHQNAIFPSSEIQCYQGENFIKNRVLGAPDKSFKVSVASQTSLSHFGPIRKSQSSQTETDKRPGGIECIRSVPAIKATKLPRFLKRDFTNCADNMVCSKHGEAQCTTVKEISELITHHVRLTLELLQRQHRMYLANCKVVKMLEGGYKENGCSLVGSSKFQL